MPPRFMRRVKSLSPAFPRQTFLFSARSALLLLRSRSPWASFARSIYLRPHAHHQVAPVCATEEREERGCFLSCISFSAHSRAFSLALFSTMATMVRADGGG